METENTERWVFEASATDRPGEPAAESPSGPVSTKRWIYLDACKIIAIFFVIVLNVTSWTWGISQVGSFNWHVLNIFNSMSRFAFPLFFMQTGALFLNASRVMPIKTLHRTYTLRIVTAFFFWSAVNMLLYYWLDAPGGFGGITFVGFFDGLLRGAEYVHWFIFLAITMYLLIPILQAAAKDINVCRYFLLLWAFFSIVLPFLYQIPTLFNSFPAPLQQAFTWVIETSERIKPLMVLDYVGYMMLGHYIHVRSFTKTGRNVFAVVGALSLLATILLTYYVSWRNGESTETFFGSFTPNVALMSASLMIVMKVSLESKWFKTHMYNGIRFFSDASFGVFLINDFLRIIPNRLGIDALSFTPLLSVPVLTILLYGVSAVLAYAIHKIPKIGSYIVSAA